MLDANPHGAAFSRRNRGAYPKVMGKGYAAVNTDYHGGLRGQEVLVQGPLVSKSWVVLEYNMGVK